MTKVSIITLGCSKNDVDSDQMCTLLDKKKYQYTRDFSEAEAIVVNTCGFIEQAKEESIDTIFEILELKKTGKLKKLLLAGCLAQRYPEELMEAIPEADGIIGPGYLSSINLALDEMFKGNKIKFTEMIEVGHLEGKYKENPSISEYVKISEGCNNRCSYCIIPYLKGNNRSRKIEDIFNEVKYLVSKGTREIILIGQNTTDYGIDLYKEYKLSSLLKELSLIEDLKWIRILYAYPDHLDLDLIDQISSNPKVVPYLDIPLQHVSDNVLKLMNRKTSKESIIDLIQTLRAAIPSLVIRTTFLVGFPGETEKDFQELLNFIEEYPIDKIGCFAYSQEEDTPAATMKNQISKSIREERRKKLMEKQEGISKKNLEKQIGEVLEILISEKVEDNLFIGRSSLDAPEVDGITYVKSEEDLKINSFIKAKITDSLEFDLIGEYYEYSK